MTHPFTVRLLVLQRRRTRSQVLIESQWEDAESELVRAASGHGVRMRESLIDPLLETAPKSAGQSAARD